MTPLAMLRQTLCTVTLLREKWRNVPFAGGGPFGRATGRTDVGSVRCLNAEAGVVYRVQCRLFVSVTSKVLGRFGLRSKSRSNRSNGLRLKRLVGLTRTILNSMQDPRGQVRRVLKVVCNMRSN